MRSRTSGAASTALLLAPLTATVIAGCLPEETLIGAPVTASIRTATIELDGVSVSANDVVPLPDGSLLVDGTAADRAVLVLAPADGRSPEILGEGGEIGAVRSIASAGSTTLVVGENGVVAVQAGALFRVPLEPMLGAMEVRSIAALPRVEAPSALDYLVATDAGLFLVRDEVASPVEVDGAGLDVSLVAMRGPGSAWAVDDEGLVRITLGATLDDAPTLSRLARLGAITALASDGEGRPWWIEDHTLFSMTRDQRVIARALPLGAGLAPSGVTAIPSDGELWVHASTTDATRTGLFHFDGHEFRAVEGEIDAMTLRCASGSACIGFDGTGEMAWITVRHGASLEGLTDGEAVHDPITVTIAADDASHVASMSATVDATTLPITGSSITLDPATIGVGPRTLVVTITWDDGTLPRVVRRSFTVEPPATWTNDIEPLYRAQCADCHGPAGPSARRLDSREGWMREIDRILPSITSGAMPLGRPRLPDTTVALVRTWSMAGFPD
ncbi:MAG: cytochrome c [Sandaracinus sp.]